VVPKHRRSEIEPLLPSASVNTADYLPEAVGYGQATATATAWPPGAHSRGGSAGNGYPAPDGYDAEPGWAADPDGQPWQEWQDWQNWGSPPELPSDHPSAPVPRIQFPDHPSGPMPAARAPGGTELPQRHPGGQSRNWGPRPRTPEGGNGNRRLYAVPDGASTPDYTANGPRPGYRQPGPGRPETSDYRREPAGYRRQANPGWQETGPATGRFRDFRYPNGDSRAAAGQGLEIHHGEDREPDRDSRAQMAQQAQDYAASLRETAEREAAEITRLATDRANVITEQANGQAAALREAAEREAAEFRARLETMTGELGRVAALLTESFAPSARPMTAPSLPDAAPALPGTFPPMPETRPARPQTQPGTRPDRPDARPGPRPAGPDAFQTRPDTRPGPRPARPDTRPGPRPAGPGTTPARKPQKRTRQQQAFRVAAGVTAAMFSVAVLTGAAELADHGYKFFVFRSGGTGATAGSETDQQFLAQEAAAAHHHVEAPKPGRHAKKSHDHK
jgi:hypothetical protein